MVNDQVGIYSTSLNLIKQDTLANFWKENAGSIGDPQIIWDPATNRFYYAGFASFSAADNRLVFGFSKNAAPNNATTDWCHYDLGFGSDFPDFPRLGDSALFIVIGANVYSSRSGFVGSDIVAISKPAAGTACPPSSTFKSAVAVNISVRGVESFTPVPANEIDADPVARIVAQNGATNTGIDLYSITKNATTDEPVFAAGSTIKVAAYSLPPSAPQKGTSDPLDTGDTRMTQAVGAIDPGHSGKFAIWTQHTIKGGAGSMVRWYEIDPVGKTLLQSGEVSSPSLFYFNAAISPDRVVRGTTRAFGSNMLLTFDASSSSVFESIRMVSKRGANSVSPPEMVKASPAPYSDFTCPSRGTSSCCRWGDYSGATPDPNSPTTRPTGIVWSTSTWTVAGDGSGGPSWQTWNWKSQP